MKIFYVIIVDDKGAMISMMRILNDVIIKCEKCGELSYVDTDSLDWDVFTYERSMGDEIEYYYKDELICENCGNKISFDIRAFEYPVGAFNYSSFECDGGNFLEEPNIEIDYELSDECFYYAYEEYLKAQKLIDEYKKRIRDMTPREFECFVADVFKNLGYSVKITKQTRDGGHDMVVTKKEPLPFTLIVECKHWNEGHKVDVSVVRSLYGVQTAMQVNQSIVVTSSMFTKDARKFADERKTMMELWELDDLLKYVIKVVD